MGKRDGGALHAIKRMRGRYDMKRLLLCSIIFISLLSVTGCASRSDFIRPSSDEYRLGVTTYGQVIQKMGDAFSSGSALMNGENVKSITYSYSNNMADPAEPDVIPARSIAFAFHKDVLVGYNYVSNFKSDNTNFDESKIKDVVKGKSTKQEALNILGKPSSFYIFPVSKERSGGSVGYHYAGVISTGLYSRRSFSKYLVISFDEKGIVSDVTYTTRGME